MRHGVLCLVQLILSFSTCAQYTLYSLKLAMGKVLGQVYTALVFLNLHSVQGFGKDCQQRVMIKFQLINSGKMYLFITGLV